MSLSICLKEVRPCVIWETSITHNLSSMACACGLYKWLWSPSTMGVKKAGDLIAPLREGLKRLRDEEDYCRTFTPKNNWGSYEGFVMFVEKLLEACKENTEARVEVER
jgi:hypothetical protein